LAPPAPSDDSPSPRSCSPAQLADRAKPLPDMPPPPWGLNLPRLSVASRHAIARLRRAAPSAGHDSAAKPPTDAAPHRLSHAEGVTTLSASSATLADLLAVPSTATKDRHTRLPGDAWLPAAHGSALLRLPPRAADCTHTAHIRACPQKTSSPPTPTTRFVGATNGDRRLSKDVT